MALHAARAIRQKHQKVAAEAASASASSSTELLDAAEITPEQRKALEEAFEAADKNGDGILSADEYYEIFLAHGLTIDREWIERTIARNDRDGDGGLNLDEFIEMNLGRVRLKKPGGASATTPTNASAAAAAAQGADNLHEKAKLAFNAYDRNRDGYLTKAELKKTSKRMTDAQIEAVFERFDRNKDGKLDFDEFKDLMESNRKQKEKSADNN